MQKLFKWRHYLALQNNIWVFCFIVLISNNLKIALPNSTLYTLILLIRDTHGEEAVDEMSHKLFFLLNAIFNAFGSKKNVTEQD